MEEENRIVISRKQLRGLFIFAANMQRIPDIEDLILIKHDAAQEFKIEVRVEDAESESGERTVAWIDMHGYVVELSTEEGRL